MTTHSPEARIVLIEERLSMGASAFAELRGKLGRLARMAIGLFGTALFVAFAAGQVVSEVHEARKVQRETQGQLEQLKKSATALEGRQDRLEDAVTDLKKSIDTKLDKALAPRVDPFGRRRPR